MVDTASEASGIPLLRISGVSKVFDGLLALSGVSLAVWPGRIKGLIGPNGAGKTTLFNLIAGTLLPTAGDLQFLGRSIVGLPPYRIAQLGIVRTFQGVQIFAGLTVLEHVLVGLHRHLRSGLVASAFRTGSLRAEEAALRARAARLLDEFGLAAWADVPADGLPFGLQRLVEMARAMATSPRLLLLDEPGAGLNATEKAAMVDLIRRLRTSGVTIFLIEHDMRLMMGLADEVAVLDRGALLAEGSPPAVQRDPQVIAAYLGEADADDVA